MKKQLILLLTLVVLVASGCSESCMDCSIQHFLTLDEIALVENICGTDDDLAQEEANLHTEYRCVQCVVFSALGQLDTGILCGTKAYTDSIKDVNEQAAQAIGASYSCEFFSDTLVIVCHPRL